MIHLRKGIAATGSAGCFRSRLCKRLLEDGNDVICVDKIYTDTKDSILALLNKSQEMKVLKAGTVGNVRIIDKAIVPEYPIKPRKFLIVIMALMIGAGLGEMSVFVRRGLSHGMEDPNLIENKFGIPVYANVLHSDQQINLERQLKKSDSDKLPILANEAGNDLTVEALRSLRTSLQFALLKSENNVIAIGGPSPGIGKSFVSVNFAHVLGDANKSVVLVDGDMLGYEPSRRIGEGLGEALEWYVDSNQSPLQHNLSYKKGFVVGIDRMLFYMRSLLSR